MSTPKCSVPSCRPLNSTVVGPATVVAVVGARVVVEVVDVELDVDVDDVAITLEVLVVDGSSSST